MGLDPLHVIFLDLTIHMVMFNETNMIFFITFFTEILEISSLYINKSVVFTLIDIFQYEAIVCYNVLLLCRIVAVAAVWVQS